MNKTRIIKKYPNRRLYDTEISSYITLDDVKKLILENISFKVVDARSEEDMTNYVLLQIISEAEGGQSPLLTTALLQNIIRFYGNPLQKNIGEFLEKSVAMLMGQNSKATENPFQTMAELTKRNMEAWQSAFSQHFTAHPKPIEPEPAPATNPKTKTKKRPPE